MAIVRKTPEAKKDLKQIWKYIARDSQTRADKFLRDMEKVFNNLAQMPLSGPRRPELGRNIRFRPFDNYVIFYEPLPDGILILHVVHGARDVDSSYFFPEEDE